MALKHNAGHVVTDDQSVARMLTKYFSLISNTSRVVDNINTNDINTNDVTSSASVIDSYGY